MKMKLGLLLITSLLLSSTVAAQDKKRVQLKCYLQLEDSSKVVHGFVNTKSSNKEFIASLPTRSVFMADGVTAS